MSKPLDLIIVGAGPAGVAAAIYASRARLSFIILEKFFTGGQIINTYEIENYPGIKATSGMELSGMFQAHAEDLDVEFLTEDVEEIIVDGDIKKVITTENTYETRTVILAMGASYRVLGVEGEKAFTGKGVSYCATCDGAFYKSKVTAVIGGGDVAVEDAIYLSRICKKVYLVHRRDELRAVKVLQESILKIENIEIIWDSELKAIQGDEQVEEIKILNNETNEEKNISVDGVFIAVGNDPNTEIVADLVKIDEKKWIETDEDCETSIKGIYAAGDIRVKSLRQVVTAAADGAIAVYAAERYLMMNG